MREDAPLNPELGANCILNPHASDPKALSVEVRVNTFVRVEKLPRSEREISGSSRGSMVGTGVGSFGPGVGDAVGAGLGVAVGAGVGVAVGEGVGVGVGVAPTAERQVPEPETNAPIALILVGEKCDIEEPIDEFITVFGVASSWFALKL